MPQGTAADGPRLSPPAPSDVATSGYETQGDAIPVGITPNASLPESVTAIIAPTHTAAWGSHPNATNQRQAVGYATESVNLFQFIAFQTGHDEEFTAGH